MRLSVHERDDVHVVRVEEAKLTYPVLATFFGEIRRLVGEGARRLVIDLERVAFIDSPSVGCLLDIQRLVAERAGVVTLAALQPRVQTMLFVSGLERILGIQRGTADALALFRAPQVQPRRAEA